MKQREISIVVNARVKSTRVPNKLLRKFGDTCLLSLSLEKLANNFNDFNCYLAAADDEIISLYNNNFKSTDINLLIRTPESVAKGLNDYRIAWEHYSRIPTGYIMWINPCAPFVLPGTYKNAIDYFVNNNDIKTMTSVKKIDNMFLDENKLPLNFQAGSAVRTQMNKSIYEWSHLFHFFDKEYFLNNGLFWDYSENNPSYYEVSSIESFDVDEPIDFAVAESLYEKYELRLGENICQE